MPIEVAIAFVNTKNSVMNADSDINTNGPESSVDPNEPEGELICGQCLRYKKERDELHNVLDETLKENEQLKCENNYVMRQYTEIKERSEEITSTMASVLEAKGDLENVNDEFANTKLAKKFKTLYDNKWTELSEWFDDNINGLNELDRIKNLTALMKSAYDECLSLADEQLRRFLFLSKDDQIPCSKDEAALFKIRRLNGQQPGTRASVIQKVMLKVLSKEKLRTYFAEENMHEVELQLKDFFQKYIESCWLMTISHPKLLLIFDVIGKPYSGTVKERFKQFSTQDVVTDLDKEKDSVFEVVWPCVILEDGTGVYAKGDVITVDSNFQI